MDLKSFGVAGLLMRARVRCPAEIENGESGRIRSFGAPFLSHGRFDSSTHQPTTLNPGEDSNLVDPAVDPNAETRVHVGNPGLVSDDPAMLIERAGDRTRTGDVQLGKP